MHGFESSNDTGGKLSLLRCLFVLPFLSKKYPSLGRAHSVNLLSPDLRQSVRSQNNLSHSPAGSAEPTNTEKTLGTQKGSSTNQAELDRTHTESCGIKNAPTKCWPLLMAARSLTRARFSTLLVRAFIKHFFCFPFPMYEMQTKKTTHGSFFSFSFSVRHQASFCSLQITASSSLNENSHEKMKQRQECRDTRGHKTKQIVPPSHISSCSGLLRSLFFFVEMASKPKKWGGRTGGDINGFQVAKTPEKKRERGKARK